MPTEPLQTHLLVLRHGRSEWNAAGRWQGHADVPLDATGRRQAADAAVRIAALGSFAAVWTSDLSRARATAEVIADAVGAESVLTDVRLRENHVGPWEGLTQSEVEHGWPGFLAARRRPDGFEAFEVAAARMVDAFRHIASRHPGSCVVVVSHGGVIRAVRRILGAEDLHLPNLAGSWFTVSDDGTVSAGELVTPEDVPARESEVL
jgi:probable phosphoglycerate mutase